MRERGETSKCKIISVPIYCSKSVALWCEAFEHILETPALRTSCDKILHSFGDKELLQVTPAFPPPPSTYRVCATFQNCFFTCAAFSFSRLIFCRLQKVAKQMRIKKNLYSFYFAKNIFPPRKKKNLRHAGDGLSCFLYLYLHQRKGIRHSSRLCLAQQVRGETSQNWEEGFFFF